MDQNVRKKEVVKKEPDSLISERSHLAASDPCVLINFGIVCLKLQIIISFPPNFSFLCLLLKFIIHEFGDDGIGYIKSCQIVPDILGTHLRSASQLFISFMASVFLFLISQAHTSLGRSRKATFLRAQNLKSSFVDPRAFYCGTVYMNSGCFMFSICKPE